MLVLEVLRINSSAQAQHGDGGLPPKLFDPEMGIAVNAGVMTYRKFSDPITRSHGDRGQKRLQKLEWKKCVDHIASDHAQLTSGVVQSVFQDPSPDCVAQMRHHTTHG